VSARAAGWRLTRGTFARVACGAGLALGLTGCGGFWKAAGAAIAAAAAEPATPAARLPRTRAELSGYRETSHYDDVAGFLDSLQALGGGSGMRIGSLGTSTEGRDIPYVIASRPLVSTPAQARRLGRPVVYVQGNIHAGEVEGKEALLALLRDLLFDPRPNALDSIVLIAVPIYNIDGNERFGPQARNRGEQNGPEVVGERANGQRLDLNRDYVKAEAPETRGSLAMFNAWDPDIFVDLHTTDGSFHGYALTYAPSLHPAAGLYPAFAGGAWARDSLLPELRRRVRVRHGVEVYDYGNFAYEEGLKAKDDTTTQGWFSYDHRPRFGTNYTGLRGRIAILSEAYSHDPFERRVRATRAFVREILSLAAERGPEIVARSRAADAAPAEWLAARSGAVPEVPVRARLSRAPRQDDVVVEPLERLRDSTVTEPGVPAGVRRSGRLIPMRMPVYDRFEPTLSRRPPVAYALGPTELEAVRLLREHGVVVERLTEDARAAGEVFDIDSAVAAPRLFQGHHEMTVGGRWRRGERILPGGSFVVPVAQPLGVLAMVLLEPESDDGLTTWNVFDRELQRGASHPVIRILEPIGRGGGGGGARRLVP
jgi:hypothetical protein